MRHYLIRCFILTTLIITGPASLCGLSAETTIPFSAQARYTDNTGKVIYSKIATATITILNNNGVQVSCSKSVQCHPGQTAYIPARVTNTGSITDNYNLKAISARGWNVSIIYDANRDGIRQDSETTQTNTTGPLAAGAYYSCFIKTTPPAGASGSDSITITALSLLNSVSSNAIATINITSTDSPVISVTKPAADCARNGDKLRIEGTVEPGSNIASIEWRNSGTGANGYCTLNGSSWSADIILEAGDNNITITAFTESGLSATATRNVNYLVTNPGACWQGLAMVSLPIIPDSTDPKEVIGFNKNYWLSFKTTENTYACYPDSHTYLTPAEQTPGRGFWTWFGDSYNSPVGTILVQDQPATIHLYKGWNIIGQPFIYPLIWNKDTITVTDIYGVTRTLGESRAIVADFVWGWQQYNNNIYSGEYYLVTDKRKNAHAVHQLDPWKGYWIRAYDECDLTLPPPSY